MEADGESGGKESVAIIGMSCRLPKARNLEEFWDILVQGQDATGTVPLDRWKKEFYPYHVSDACKTMNAGFLSVPVDKFDSGFFGISPKESTYMDPQARLLLEVTWEALEDAGLNPHSLKNTDGGVFTGSWLNDYKDILLHCADYQDFYRTYSGNSIGSMAARLSFHLGLTGPSIATESGCSSSMVAVHLACNSIQQGMCGIAVACGVNLLLKPFDKEEMPIMLSPDGRCKTFDIAADGFARAEGVGVLVLKKLSHALKDGDDIWGIIKGSAVTQEGLSKSMGTPTVHSEALAMKLALKDSGVKPSQVSYVEAHGTGTKVGDPMEMQAIAKAYGSNERKEPLIIGSVKTNVGHTEACSGITGIIKVLLAMNQNIIPKHVNLQTLNPAIDLKSIPAIIPQKILEWVRTEEKPRIAGVSSFGITGTDAHVIIQEPPQILQSKENDYAEDRPCHILKFSAKSNESLDRLLTEYKDFFVGSTDLLSDIAYTANVGRSDFPFKAVVVAGSKEECRNEILHDKILKNERTVVLQNVKICFLFTGQGSQYPKMAAELYKFSPTFRKYFDYCCNILENNYNIDIKAVIWTSDVKEEIHYPIYSQTAIFCLEFALMKLWKSWGINPDYVLGHSLGEFTAAVCSGVLLVEDALMLLTERSLLIHSLSEGKMLVVAADKETVSSKMLEAGVNLDFAALNSLEQTVVAGDSADVLKLETYLRQESKIRCSMLRSSHAFHSRHMDPILDTYQKVCRRMKPNFSMKCGYISGVKGALITDSSKIDDEYWVCHARQPVAFLEACKVALKCCNTFLEIGPNSVLSALLMSNVASLGYSQNLLVLPSIKKNSKDWQIMLGSLAKLFLNGFSVNWKGLDQDYPRKKVRIPHYQFVGKRYWPVIRSRQLLQPSNQKMISCHPLLGVEIVNASSTRIFLNQPRIDEDQRLAFINDHKIGKYVIFPAAAYLSMILNAGTGTSFEYQYSQTIENLEILAPLAMATNHELTYVNLETAMEVCSKDGWGCASNVTKYVVKICQRFESTESATPKYNTHARATVYNSYSGQSDKLANILFTDWRLPNLEAAISNETFYKKMAATGLIFGNSFKSILQYWDFSTSLLAELDLQAIIGTLDENEEFDVLHTVIIDSMLQTIALLSQETLRVPTQSHKTGTLRVPVSVGRFVTANKTKCLKSDTLFVFVSQETENSSIMRASLIDSKGFVFAEMFSVQFVETTLRSIEAVVAEQGKASKLFELWEEVWKPLQVYETQYRLDFHLITNRNIGYSEDISQLWLTPDRVQQNDKMFMDTVYFYIVLCMYKLGWQMESGLLVDQLELFDKLKVSKNYRGYFDFMLQVLNEHGILAKLNNKWKVIKNPPEYDKIMSMNLMIQKDTEDISSISKTSLLISKVGSHLSDILEGQMPPLPLLFPENSNEVSVDCFYREYVENYGSAKITQDVFENRFSCYKNYSEQQRFILRILEVGAGTGGYTGIILQTLENLNIEYEYTYSDISTSFFDNAEKRFFKYRKNLIFRKLNIEEDPLEQGFVPQYYDIIFAFEVLHATKDIAETLQNIRKLLRIGGTLDIWETTRTDAHFITFIFGLLPGYWRFQDRDLRNNRCFIERNQWETVLRANGFEVKDVFKSYLETSSLICTQATYYPEKEKNITSRVWLVFPDDNISNDLLNKLYQIDRAAICIIDSKENGPVFLDMKTSGLDKSHTVNVNLNSETDLMEIYNNIANLDITIEGILFASTLKKKRAFPLEYMQQFYNITKNIDILRSRVKMYPLRTIVLTTGTLPSENRKHIWSISSSALLGYSRSLCNEMGNLISCRFLDINKLNSLQTIQQIFYEMYVEGDIETIIQDETKYFSKLVPYKPKIKEEELALPVDSDRFQLILPESKSIIDLKFGNLPKQNLGSNEVELKIKCVALNFRDILSVLKPTPQFHNMNTVGLDLVGEVVKVGPKVTRWKIGDVLLTLNMDSNGKALPSHMTLDENFAIKIPDHLTYCEGATLPAVFSTAYKCLIKVAKLKQKDTVLIHTGSGGVGLVAIDLCRKIVPIENIIVTAGSNRKRSYLEGLGVQHIFNSRDTNYSKEILKITAGKGVNVVLNSLTSEGFKEATLKCCSRGARFIEMSKINVWSTEEVKQMRPDIFYKIVDVSALDHKEIRFLLEKLHKGLLTKSISPLPYVRFDAVRVRQAMQYFQKAKHIGKVVLVFPERKFDNNERINHWFTPLFNPRSTYLITGGLGGIGFEVGKWMVKQGAKHVVLAGRNPPKPDILSEITRINKEMGCNIMTVVMDVSCIENCKHVLNENFQSLGLPQLRGIMHSAGTIADGFIVNQNWSTWSSTLKPKVNGTLNLHELTKHFNLEYFVLFSSFVAQLGSPGQSNHAAANQFEDSFAHYRNSIGLAATTINWGNWCEVGVATKLDFKCFKPITTKQGISALEHVLRTNRLHTMAFNLEDFDLMQRLFPKLYNRLDKRFLSQLESTSRGGNSLQPNAGKADFFVLSTDQFFDKYNAEKDCEVKKSIVKEQVRRIMNGVLKISSNDDTIRDQSEFESVGVDSLMFIEIKNALQCLFGDKIDITEGVLRERNTVALLSDTIFSQLEGQNSQLPT